MTRDILHGSVPLCGTVLELSLFDNYRIERIDRGKSFV